MDSKRNEVPKFHGTTSLDRHAKLGRVTVEIVECRRLASERLENLRNGVLVWVTEFVSWYVTNFDLATILFHTLVSEGHSLIFCLVDRVFRDVVLRNVPLFYSWSVYS